tara:strand:- start:148 stop:312 length:165 start_codon:yes stop_codon:yes gene_type:complete
MSPFAFVLIIGFFMLGMVLFGPPDLSTQLYRIAVVWLMSMIVFYLKFESSLGGA